MTSTPVPSAAAATQQNLASVFQEVLTAILRVRYQPQQVPDATAFRAHLRRLLQTAMTDARALGYSNPNIQTGVLAVVGFLDESVLNLPAGSPVVNDWSRRPLQEELFGGHLAGETVFVNLNSLLQQQDSGETADVLELHCLVLELGYKGRYAFSRGGELHNLIRLCQEKILRCRGSHPLFPAPVPTPREPIRTSDPVARALLIAAIGLVLITGGAFAGYKVSLGSAAQRLGTTGLLSR